MIINLESICAVRLQPYNAVPLIKAVVLSSILMLPTLSFKPVGVSVTVKVESLSMFFGTSIVIL